MWDRAGQREQRAWIQPPPVPGLLAVVWSWTEIGHHPHECCAEAGPKPGPQDCSSLLVEEQQPIAALRCGLEANLHF